MRRLTVLFTAAFLLSTASVVCSQTLADLAKKEKERREQLKDKERVITNKDAAKFKSSGVMTPSAQPEAAAPKPAPDKATAVKPAKADSDEPTDFQGRPESFWRQTLADARAKVRDLGNEANVLILRLNDLQNRFYRESDGFRQQEIQREMNKTIYEQDQNKEKLATAKSQLEDLLGEARKSGALPGWLDEKSAKP